MSPLARWSLASIPVLVWSAAHVIDSSPSALLRTELLLCGHPFARLVPANLDQAYVDYHVSTFIIHEGKPRIGYVDMGYGVNLDYGSSQWLTKGIELSFALLLLQGASVLLLPFAIIFAARGRSNGRGFPMSPS